jgi:hypothetical protein
MTDKAPQLTPTGRVKKVYLTCEYCECNFPVAILDGEMRTGVETLAPVGLSLTRTQRKAKPMTNQSFYVEIVETSTGNVIKRMGPSSERSADRVANGAERNLNHSDYFVRVVGS